MFGEDFIQNIPLLGIKFFAESPEYKATFREDFIDKVIKND